MKSAMRARRVALSGMLVALMLIMGYIESLIPLTSGIPGIKPGLSNGVLIFAVYMFDLPLTYCLMILKVLLTGLMFGGVSAMLYSFAGGLLSLTGMCLMRRIPHMRPEITGMAGGMLHNVGQTAMAMIVLRTPKLAGYLTVLIPVGIACGLLTGFLTRLVMQRLETTGTLPKLKGGKSGAGILIILAILLALTLYTIFAWNPLLRHASESKTEWSTQGIEIPALKGN